MEKNKNGYSEYNFGKSGSGGSTGGGADQDGSDFGTAVRQLAMVYAPYQCWRRLYSPEDAMKHGTMFEELYKPLLMCKGENGNG